MHAITEWRQGPAYGTAARVDGVPPAVMLWDPKYPANVGAVVRLASCYGIGQVWQFGERVAITSHDKDYRLPREERMRGYGEVKLVKCQRPLDAFPNDTNFVAVEFRDNAELLPHFVHPANACYVFGPEDGSLPKIVLMKCRRFVIIPTQHCLNLATCVATVLYDRGCKLGFPPPADS
jgi:tRNA(Leu) C34 or U34 (ribose-2'-O)-methylase TrmL